MNPHLAAGLATLFALFQRLMSLEGGTRQLTLALLDLAVLFWTPSFSGLGSSREFACIVGSHIVGELLGYPFELQRRYTFAHSARSLTPTPTAVAPHRPLHPLTLRFADGALERAYIGRAFGDRYPLGICLVTVALLALIHSTPRELQPAATIFSITIAVLLCTRAALHRSLDQCRAAFQFGWAWCVMWSLSWAALLAAHRQFGAMRDQSPSVTAIVVLLCSLFALVQRLMALPVAPRLLTLVAVALARAVYPSATVELNSRPPECLVED
jgi:hypothetical protein